MTGDTRVLVLVARATGLAIVNLERRVVTADYPADFARLYAERQGVMSIANGDGATPRVLIVGAGIAGLATAGALAGVGWEVEVVERRAAFNGAATGLFIPANGVRALRALGIADGVIARGRDDRAAGRAHRGRCAERCRRPLHPRAVPRPGQGRAARVRERFEAARDTPRGA